MTFPILDRWFGPPPEEPGTGHRGGGDGRRDKTTQPSLRTAPLSETDATLIAQLGSPDVQVATSALEHVHAAWAIPLARYTERLIHSADLADDIVQDVFLSVWIRRDHLATAGSLRAYLFGAVHRHALRRMRDVRVADRWAQRISTEILTSTELRGQDIQTPDVRVEADELASVLRATVDALAPRQRQALLLYREQELSLNDVAEVMGISVNTVKVQLQRAGATLREAVKQYLA
jgi:RNA polymerase sigma-70 factor (ECF subfamily)